MSGTLVVECEQCRQNIALDRDGTLSYHMRNVGIFRTKMKRCPGAGYPPSLMEQAMLPGNEWMVKGYEVYEHAQFLSRGGRFKISSLGNYARWDVDVLRFAAERAEERVHEWNPSTDTTASDRRETARLRGVHKALVQATSQASDRAYRNSSRRNH